jgi:hypothetical protein
VWRLPLLAVLSLTAPASQPRARVLLVPIADFPSALMAPVAAALERELDVEVRVGPRRALPDGAWLHDEVFDAAALLDYLDTTVFMPEHRVDPSPRAPLDASLDELLEWLGDWVERARNGPKAADAVLGLTTVPLAARTHPGALTPSSVSGLASAPSDVVRGRDGRLRVIMTAGPAVAIATDFGYTNARLGIVEVAVHEVGHLLGLPDTFERDCVMNGHGDGRARPGGERLCPRCRERLDQVAPR